MDDGFDRFMEPGQDLTFSQKLHAQVCLQQVLVALESPSGRNVVLHRLKQAGLVLGGTVGGALLLGPVGSAIGAGLGDHSNQSKQKVTRYIAGAGVATDLKAQDEAIEKVVQYLRTMSVMHQHTLVKLVEAEFELKSTEQFDTLAKAENSRQKLAAIATDFVADEIASRTAS